MHFTVSLGLCQAGGQAAQSFSLTFATHPQGLRRQVSGWAGAARATDYGERSNWALGHVGVCARRVHTQHLRHLKVVYRRPTGLGLGAPCCQGQRTADLPHLLFAHGADERLQSPLVHGLHMVKIDCRVMLQALFRPDWHLARKAPYRGSDRRDHRVAQERKNSLPRENHNGPSLVGFAEPVLPDLPSPETSP